MEANGPNVVEGAQPTVSRASFVGWPLRWKVAAIMVLPVLLAATFGALRIQNELSAASKLSVAADGAVQALADRLVNVLAAQRALTTQRVLAAAPDFTDSVVLRTRVAEAAGAESAAIDRLAQLNPTGEGTAVRKAFDTRRDADPPP